MIENEWIKVRNDKTSAKHVRLEGESDRIDNWLYVLEHTHTHWHTTRKKGIASSETTYKHREACISNGINYSQWSWASTQVGIWSDPRWFDREAQSKALNEAVVYIWAVGIHRSSQRVNGISWLVGLLVALLSARFTHSHALPAGHGAEGSQGAKGSHGTERRNVIRTRPYCCQVYQRQLHPQTSRLIQVMDSSFQIIKTHFHITYSI